MQSEKRLYAKLRKDFVHKEGLHDCVRSGDYEVVVFDWDQVAREGGAKHKNLACFDMDGLRWLAEFQGATTDGWNVATGVRPSPRGADKVLVSTWDGGLFDVDIATGAYESVGWAK
jgi:hypothetical protein